MLIVFPTIFVADTKIIYGYNFVAPLIGLERKAMRKSNEGNSKAFTFLSTSRKFILDIDMRGK